MMEERKNLLLSMNSQNPTSWSYHQEERLVDLQRHVNRMREFLLNGSPEGPAATN